MPPDSNRQPPSHCGVVKVVGRVPHRRVGPTVVVPSYLVFLRHSYLRQPLLVVVFVRLPPLKVVARVYRQNVTRPLHPPVIVAGLPPPYVPRLADNVRPPDGQVILQLARKLPPLGQTKHEFVHLSP